MPTPKRWKPSSRRFWRNSAFPTRMRIGIPVPTGSGQTEMADSEPTHDNPRNTRNLPAVGQEGEVLRPPADNWLMRAIRTLFGLKPGSVPDDLPVVLHPATPAQFGFSAKARPL